MKDNRKFKEVFKLNDFNKNIFKSLKKIIVNRSGYTTLSALCFYSEYLSAMLNSKSLKIKYTKDMSDNDIEIPIEDAYVDKVIRIPSITSKLNMRTKDLTEAYYIRILFPLKTKIIDLETDSEYKGKVFKQGDTYYGKSKILEGDEKFYGNQGLLVSFPFDDIINMISMKRKPFVAEYNNERYPIFLLTPFIWMDITTITESVILCVRNDFDNMCHLFNSGDIELNND